MTYQASQGIGEIDNTSAALSAIRESVVILAARWRDDFNDYDLDELQRILDACDRIQDYHLIVRRVMSEEYQDRLGIGK